MSPEYLKEKVFPVPGRGFLASIIVLLSIAGGIGAWYFVAYSWRVGCEGSATQLAPATGSPQAFRCTDLGQRDPRYFLAALGVVGVIVVAVSARRWMFGHLRQILLVLAVLAPIVIPYVGYLALSRPSDECDALGRADLHAAVKAWEDGGKQGDKPTFCDRV